MGDGIVTRQDAVSLGEKVMDISRAAQDRWRDEQETAKAAAREEIAGLAAESAARQQGSS